MARTNGPIQVWHRGDTIPTDAQGGYAGGDSTAAAVGASLAQSGDALGLIGDDTGMSITTVTDRNLLPLAEPPVAGSGGWSPVSSSGTTSTATTEGSFVRSTATSDAASGHYHGLQTQWRPPITPGAHGHVHLAAEVRSTGATTVRLYVQWLAGTSSLGYPLNRLDVTVPEGEWTPLYTTAVDVPPTADNYRISVWQVGPFANGSTVDLRHTGVITSDRGWFNGGTPDTGSANEDRTHVWDGTPGESTSTRTITTRTPTGGLGGRTVIQAIRDLEEGGGRSAAPVPAPPGFALRRLPMPEIHRDGTRYSTDVEGIIDELRPPQGVTYYAAPGASASADGLTAATATTLEAARGKSDVGTIVLAPGEYDRRQARVPGRTSKSINYVAAGPGVVLTGWSETLSWTHVSGNIYATARTGAVSVGDPRIEHSTDGALTMYAQVGETSAAITGPGQWATDGTTVWVWALGDVDLATHPTTLRVGLSVDVGVMHDGGTAYVEGITIEGTGAGRGLNMIGGTLLLRDCAVQGADRNGVTAVDALVIAVRCDALTNGMDGFNYHEASGQCDFIEVDCTARRNGWKRTGTNNGSTAHETVRGVRVGGRYADCHGPLLADVNNAETWTLGAVTERTDLGMLPPASQQGHYHADGAGAVMWVQDGDLSGDGTAWRVSNGASLRVRNPRRVGVASTANLTGDGSTLERW